MEFNRNLVSGAVIRTDIFRNNSNDESIVNYGRAFNIDPMEIEDIMKAIRLTCEEYDILLSRIYISGFGLVSKNDLWSKEKIVNYLKNDLEAIKKHENKQENAKVLKK